MHLEAAFISSALKMSQCPRWDRTEVAVAGRSNVGKSSLLNALSGQRHLARTSKTPGRTRCLNFFAVRESLALVDLPGYGYASMARADAARIGALMRDYLRRRANLAALVMLVDARRGPEHEEMELSRLSRRADLELIVVATKSDKLKRSERASALERFRVLGFEPILSSTADGEGIEELRRRILAIAAGDRRHRVVRV
jgi:GTP-binding protein